MMNNYNEIESKLYMMQYVLESVTDLGFMACDKEGRIVIYNAPSVLQDNVSEADVVGKKMADVFDLKEGSAVLEVLRTGQPVLNELQTYITPTGEEKRILGSAYPIIRDDELIGAFAVIRFHDGMKQLILRTMDLQKQLFASAKSKNGSSYYFDDIIGEDPAFKQAIKMAKKAATGNSSVLVYGETGTGKELFVQGIHNASVFSDSPFVAINCAAIPDNLMESTLFGTKKGAFTGANDMPGLLEEAKNGTVFLDELNSMHIHLQSKLLRAIQEKTIRRVGGTVDIPICCRFIASCNKPPLECIENNELRDDLYFRLSVIGIDIPPLRDRKSDIPILTDYFVKKYSKIYGHREIETTPAFRKALELHNWPGNVRELEHIIESAVVMTDPGEPLDVSVLNPRLRGLYDKEKKTEPETVETGVFDSLMSGEDLKSRLLEFEKIAIIHSLEVNNWNISKAAKELGYSRSNLQYRMQKLEIEGRIPEE